MQSVYAINVFPRLAKAIHAPSEVYSIRFLCLKKGLKIPKEQSEVVDRRRTDNTMNKEKDKSTSNNLQNTMQTTKD
jgi:hypothetical protein